MWMMLLLSSSATIRLDDTHLIYTRKDGGVGIFHIGFNDLININLAAGLDGEVFILR
jgi:hypothetical protein